MPINEMTELMYVADIHTYDLLFVNDAGKKLFDIEEFTGLKCYKALQGFDKPCDFCPNAKLSKDETYTWEHSNPVIHGHYLLKIVSLTGKVVRQEWKSPLILPRVCKRKRIGEAHKKRQHSD
ncbi:MAG: hypothetical protein ACLRL6_01180 [Clostridium sp.]